MSLVPLARRDGAPSSARGAGLLYGVAAYGSWGFFPIYLKAVMAASVLEVLSHRVVWSLAFLLAVGWWQGSLGAIRTALAERRTFRVMAASTVLIAANWGLYVYAVVSARMMEASLGYYVNPLVNVLLGVAVLGERLERPVVAAVGIAAAGVLWMGIAVGQSPGLSLALAATFGTYGLLRKLAPVGAFVGLAVETTLLAPLAVGYLLWAVRNDRAVFLHAGPGMDVLLVLAGPLTAVPLLCFAAAARRLPLTTMGFLQYLSPTVQFLLAALVYGEPFDRNRAVAFALIWTALAVFALHSLRRGQPEPVTLPD